MRAFDAWKGGGPSSAVASTVACDGYRGPTRAEKKIYAGDGATRENQKGLIISAGAMARERKKFFWRAQERKNKFRAGGKQMRGREKKIISAGAKKNSGDN